MVVFITALCDGLNADSNTLRILRDAAPPDSMLFKSVNLAMVRNHAESAKAGCYKGND